MGNAFLIKIENLILATRNHGVSWKKINNTYCLTAHYENKGIIICRYTFPDSQKSVISFNYLDENNSVIGDLNIWQQEKEEFGKINELYEAALHSSPQAIHA